MSNLGSFIVGIFVGWLIWSQEVGRWRMVFWPAAAMLIVFGGLYAAGALLEEARP
jgi:hypothetical protein